MSAGTCVVALRQPPSKSMNEGGRTKCTGLQCARRSGSSGRIRRRRLTGQNGRLVGDAASMAPDRFWKSFGDLPGPALDRIGAIAACHRVQLTVGVIERDRNIIAGRRQPNGSWSGRPQP